MIMGKKTLSIINIVNINKAFIVNSAANQLEFVADILDFS